MGTAIKCFMVEETGTVDLQLRRYKSSPNMGGCSVHPYGYHNAELIAITNVPAVKDGEGFFDVIRTPKDDPRWPKTCVCGYEFTDDDVWQTNQIERYRRLDTGEEIQGPSHKLPAGAMWYGNLNWRFYYPNPTDGKVLICMTPDGERVVDGRANNGPRDAAGWTRTGVPPLVVARPSIQTGSYHGFLGGADGSQPGYLVEC